MPGPYPGIESGQLSPAQRFARACDEAFPQMGGWFGRFYRASLKWDALYPRWFEDWVDAEGRAAVIRWWEPLLVPGLLQTPEYARALFRAWRTDDDEEQGRATGPCANGSAAHLRPPQAALVLGGSR
jgi:hypothetical protein